MLELIHKIITKVWKDEIMPSDWEEGLICPIYKKGDPLECTNYRGITLINVAYKIFSNILYERLKIYTDNVIRRYQCGFREGRSTIDQIHAMRQIIERLKEYKIDTYYLFIDFRAAYDSIDRRELLLAMSELGIPAKLIKLTQMTIKRIQCKIKIYNYMTELFYTGKGLRQGDALACLLFNIVMEKVIRDSNIDTRATIHTKSIQLLGYADDLVIVSRSIRDLKDAFIKLESAARKMGLVINEDKTKYMEIVKGQPKFDHFSAGHFVFQRVKEFKYLGVQITDDGKIDQEIKHRLIIANKSYYGLMGQMRSKYISRGTKIKLYKTLIRPVLIYGAETWAINKENEDKLAVFERKILRRIYGPVCEAGGWRIRYNAELYKKFRDPDIVREVKARRVRWLGHLYRTEEQYPARMLTFNTIYGTRRVGRPPRRWLQYVEDDLLESGVGAWRRMAGDRERWKRIVGAVKAGKRL